MKEPSKARQLKAIANRSIIEGFHHSHRLICPECGRIFEGFYADVPGRDYVLSELADGTLAMEVSCADQCGRTVV